jgi:hypothetical protein
MIMMKMLKYFNLSHNEEPYWLNTSHNIARITKSWKLRWAVNTAKMRRDVECIQRIFVRSILEFREKDERISLSCSLWKRIVRMGYG